MSVNTEERRRAAAVLIRRGAAPIPAGEKNPGRRGWEALRITEEEIPAYWNNGQNVGLLCGEPSGGRVDVDLDADEAVKIAGRFLAPTLTSGRKGRPHSHWWYVSPGIVSCDWKGADGNKLVELRSTGRQTLVAPSTHPDGDAYVWHTETGLKMAEIDGAELTRRLRELATAVLIARHLPPIRTGTEGGGRHDYALAVAGFLLRPGRLGEDLTLKVLKAAWDAKGWPGEKEKREAHRDLEGIVPDTAENLEAGEEVTGGPALEKCAPGIVGLLCKWWGWERRTRETEGKTEEKEERRNQADRLIGYALEDVQELFVDQHGAPHALIADEPVPMTSRCYSWLRRLMWEEEGRSVSGEYLKMAAGTLSAQAEFSGVSRELYTRAAWHEGILYYELRRGKVVRVGPGGWTFEANPPVLFRRYVNLKALPDPEAGGSLDVLDELVNLKSERDRRLFKAYLATLPLEHVGRPIFNASGAMGSGKTTIGRVVKRTWDPTAPETVRFDPRDFLQKAMHAYVVMLDNQNTIPEWAADTLCRLVTGGADSKRRLYTDDEDFIIELRRPAILNGINVPTDRGDVLDRSLVVELERIADGERKTEEQIWELFAREHPGLLGALFDVLSKAIALKPSIKLSRRPRLADWGEYAAAVYEAMGWGAETFLRDWDEVVRVQNQATLDGSPVAQAIIKLMEEHEEVSCTSSKMHALLKEIAEAQGVDVARDKAWPKSARWLWRRIQEVLSLLVAAGIEASRGRDESAKQVTLRKLPKDDGSDGSRSESRTGKAETHANTAQDDGRSNGSGGDNGMPNGREKPPSVTPDKWVVNGYPTHYETTHLRASFD
ncbi:MAG: bifunctional DNA primase/polymerase [Actinomycetota bacterium]|nr:bifunctional DNA primase/polymerase [Actinomycetota bacterium]